MKNWGFFLIVGLIAFSSCSKEKQRVRKLSGTWNVVSYTDRWVYTGDCGVPFGYFDEFTISNLGTLELTKDDPYWAGVTDDDAHAGSWNLKYTYIDPQTSNQHEVVNNMVFDWYILDDNLIIHNPDQFVFEVYDLEAFSKKSWDMSFADDPTSQGCTYNEKFYTVEKD